MSLTRVRFRLWDRDHLSVAETRLGHAGMGPLRTCRRQQRVASDIWWHRDTRARSWGHKDPLTGTAPAYTGMHRL